MGEIFIYLIPRKYRTIGHFLIGFGGFFIIFIMIYLYDLINIIGQLCIIIGLSGIYYSKTKNFRAVKDVEEKNESEQKSINGIDEKTLPRKGVYVFYIITFLGILFSSYFLILLFTWVLGGDSTFISIMLGYPVMLSLGDLLLLGGLVILYYKKRKEYWYRSVDEPIRYRISQPWKCNICGNKFRSKSRQCPNCGGENLKQRW